MNLLFISFISVGLIGYVFSIWLFIQQGSHPMAPSVIVFIGMCSHGIMACLNGIGLYFSHYGKNYKERRFWLIVMAVIVVSFVAFNGIFYLLYNGIHH